MYLQQGDYAIVLWCGMAVPLGIFVGHIVSNVTDCTWLRMTVVFRDRDRAMLLAIVVTVPMTIIG